MTAPNIITLLRLLCVPLFVVFCVQGGYLGYLYATIILGMMELSDLLDGHVARRFNQSSRLGKLLDPMADSISRFSIFLTLFKIGVMPFWMVFVFFVRDTSITYYRAFAAAEGLLISARASGKIKALVQAFGSMLICMLLVWKAHPELLSDSGDQFTRGLIAQGVAGAIMMVGIIAARLSPLILGSCLGFLFSFNTVLILPHWVPSLSSINSELWIDLMLYGIVAVTLYSFVDYTYAFIQAMFRSTQESQVKDVEESAHASHDQRV